MNILALPLKNRIAHSVKRYGEIMRSSIISSITPEDTQNLRHLRAIEGYLYLGMFEEAEEELRELDPTWFALERTLWLEIGVHAGLSHCK